MIHMAIYTPEQLKAMFNQSRQRKEKERQRQRLEKQKQYKALCKQADILLKQALQDEKRKRMEQLQALVKKTPQKPLKWTITEFTMSNNRYIEKDNDGLHYYQTREELMAAEERGEGKINWTVWDRLITEFKNNLL